MSARTASISCREATTRRSSSGAGRTANRSRSELAVRHGLAGPYKIHIKQIMIPLKPHNTKEEKNRKKNTKTTKTRTKKKKDKGTQKTAAVSVLATYPLSHCVC